MSTPALQVLKYKEVIIKSLDGKNTFDLTNSILFADYYEDILSPCITATIQVASSYSILHGIPIRGGEVVTFNAETYSGEFKLTEDFALYVYKVSGILHDGTKEMFTLHLTSREGLTNETVRVQKKYEKQPINNHVNSILNDVLRTKKLNQKI